MSDFEMSENGSVSERETETEVENGVSDGEEKPERPPTPPKLKKAVIKPPAKKPAAAKPTTSGSGGEKKAGNDDGKSYSKNAMLGILIKFLQDQPKRTASLQSLKTQAMEAREGKSEKAVKNELKKAMTLGVEEGLLVRPKGAEDQGKCTVRAVSQWCICYYR